MENKLTNNNPIDYDPPNSIAAIWSMMLPGLGQLLKGRAMPGLFWAMLVASGYFSYFWPGIVLHGLCILDAALIKGSGSFIDCDTWPRRMGLILLVASLLIYIVIRNSYWT